MLLGSFFAMQAQTVLFSDDFEGHEDFIIEDIGDWITIDLDGSETYTGGGGEPWETAGVAQAFIIFNPGVAGVSNAEEGVDDSEENRDFDPHGGAKYAAAWASVEPTNDDWLVSPEVMLGGEGNVARFWVKSMSDTYGLEEYEVGVFTGDGEPVDSDDFTIVRESEEAAFGVWEEVVVQLDDYAGQNVRVGIHCISDDAYMFMVDDFSITTDAPASANDVLSAKFSVSPNPANNFVGFANADNMLVSGVQIMDINGRIVKSSAFNAVTEGQINISDLAAGTYMMKKTTDNGAVTKKVVKK